MHILLHYPHLANHFKDNFGSCNYFGGDGSTTFAVPDLRGEFLRGNGTATRNSGSGADVGVHQSPTKQISIGFNSSEKTFWIDGSAFSDGSITNASRNVDMYLRANSTIGKCVSLRDWSGSSGYAEFTARPTNTSVLYCIKCEPIYSVSPSAV